MIESWLTVRCGAFRGRFGFQAPSVSIVTMYLLLCAVLSSAQNVPAALFPTSNEVPGWSIKRSPVNYQANQLFDYMDGAAEIPKSYNFRSLGSAKYQNSNTTLEVAIFDMGSAADAYGYYSARVFLEHSPRAKERIVSLDHPAHIYSTVGVLTFWKDRYTIILQPDDGKPDDSSLLRFAKLISSHIPDKGALPALLTILPKTGLIANSARYVHGKAAFDATIMFTAKDVFGMSEGPTAVAAEYNLAGVDSTLAIIKYTKADAATRAVADLRKLMVSGKAQFGTSSISGAFVCLSTGRAKGVGAAAEGSFVMLTVGQKDAAGAESGLKMLVKSKAGNR